MRKVVRVYQEWISMEDKPVFMKEPDDSGSHLGEKEEEVRDELKPAMETNIQINEGPYKQIFMYT